MTLDKKTNIAWISSLVLVVLICLFAVRPLLSHIKEEADNFVLQKSRLAELETRESNLQSFKHNRQEYQASLARIDDFFINASEPIGFIEFLEKEAADADLAIEITPFPSQKLEGDSWPSMNFRLAISGDFPNFLQFLEKLELSPYLLEASSLNVRQVLGSEGAIQGIEATLLLKVYSKQ